MSGNGARFGTPGGAADPGRARRGAAHSGPWQFSLPRLRRAATMLGVRGTLRAARHPRSFNQERARPCRAVVPGDGALPAEGGAAEEALAAQMSEGYA
ncbi:hypothetical protein GCM10010329_72010 [Streptomyces spiroverticillatus]|uniref:Uncharacterized protein n=1 Tax=Streptomyces finlayi TaxID=67296 RepID=A0A918X0C3_9ACTN|nr:hypothetical protein GCM10010329_72010 [Streptomyces spiroverticillatus]GHD00706.1 hypothetical protein GCM10010334_45430 [Streptomyces finlayi]